MTIFKRRYNSLSNKLLRVACQPLTILNILNHLISDLFLIPQVGCPKEGSRVRSSSNRSMSSEFVENLGSPEFHFRHKTFFHTKLRHSTTLNSCHTFSFPHSRNVEKKGWDFEESVGNSKRVEILEFLGVRKVFWICSIERISSLCKSDQWTNWSQGRILNHPNSFKLFIKHHQIHLHKIKILILNLIEPN